MKVEVLDQLKNSKRHFNDTDLQYVEDKFLEFCKNQTLKSAILRSADLLQRGQYGEIKVMIDGAMKAGTQKDIGLRWDEDFEKRHIEAARNTMTTGWTVVDKYLDGEGFKIYGNDRYVSQYISDKYPEDEIKFDISKITDEALFAYNVYQIEGEGRSLFSKIEGDENTIMGLPINKIKEYLSHL